LGQYEVLLKAPPSARSDLALLQNATSYERVARLYWRAGRRSKAIEMFEALLKNWPDSPRAPLVSMSILALKNAPETGDSGSRLGFLCMPLAGVMVPAGTTATAVPASSPDPEPPMLKATRDLLNQPGLRPDWAGYIRLHYAWMLFQLGRLTEAEAEFLAAGSTGTGLQIGEFSPYCFLGAALIYNRQQRWDESINLAREMAQAAGEGHARALAGQLLTASQKMRDDSQKPVEENDDSVEEASSQPS
jgi:tetratricopeptide (TPR) repeat protein